MAYQDPFPGLPLPISGETLMIASFSDMPRQRINLAPTNTLFGAQIQQIKTKAKPPTVDGFSPINVQRMVIGGSNQFRVQFLAPTSNPNYQSTSILIKSSDGTLKLSASAAGGPIVFNTPKTPAQGSIIVQQSNESGSSSSIDFGNSSGRTLNLT